MRDFFFWTNMLLFCRKSAKFPINCKIWTFPMALSRATIYINLKNSQQSFKKKKKKKKKSEIHKYMKNFYAWHDVGKRKCRLVESLSRMLKYNWWSHSKENRQNPQHRMRKYESSKREVYVGKHNATEVKIWNIFT